jgi:hypothetical protein
MSFDLFNYNSIDSNRSDFLNEEFTFLQESQCLNQRTEMGDDQQPSQINYRNFNEYNRPDNLMRYNQSETNSQEYVPPQTGFSQELNSLQDVSSFFNNIQSQTFNISSYFESPKEENKPLVKQPPSENNITQFNKLPTMANQNTQKMKKKNMPKRQIYEEIPEMSDEEDSNFQVGFNKRTSDLSDNLFHIDLGNFNNQKKIKLSFDDEDLNTNKVIKKPSREAVEVKLQKPLPDIPKVTKEKIVRQHKPEVLVKITVQNVDQPKPQIKKKQVEDYIPKYLTPNQIIDFERKEQYSADYIRSKLTEFNTKLSAKKNKIKNIGDLFQKYQQIYGLVESIQERFPTQMKKYLECYLNSLCFFNQAICLENNPLEFTLKGMKIRVDKLLEKNGLLTN